jgi:hypothetical protein
MAQIKESQQPTIAGHPVVAKEVTVLLVAQDMPAVAKGGPRTHLNVKSARFPVMTTIAVLK